MGLEIHQDWVKLLPLVLLKLRAFPPKTLNLSPFELLYGCPFLPPGLPTLSPYAHLYPLHLPLLTSLLNTLWKDADSLLPANNSPIQVGDQVYVSPPA
jgi:hypothetical protein